MWAIVTDSFLSHAVCPCHQTWSPCLSLHSSDPHASKFGCQTRGCDHTCAGILCSSAWLTATAETTATFFRTSPLVSTRVTLIFDKNQTIFQMILTKFKRFSNGFDHHLSTTWAPNQTICHHLKKSNGLKWCEVVLNWCEVAHGGQNVKFHYLIFALFANFLSLERKFALCALSTRNLVAPFERRDQMVSKSAACFSNASGFAPWSFNGNATIWDF